MPAPRHTHTRTHTHAHTRTHWKQPHAARRTCSVNSVLQLPRAIPLTHEGKLSWAPLQPLLPLLPPLQPPRVQAAAPSCCCGPCCCCWLAVLGACAAAAAAAAAAAGAWVGLAWGSSGTAAVWYLWGVCAGGGGVSHTRNKMHGVSRVQAMNNAPARVPLPLRGPSYAEPTPHMAARARASQ
jgi:hypothetical protein